mgnify:CR=1 FL=1
MSDHQDQANIQPKQSKGGTDNSLAGESKDGLISDQQRNETTWRIKEYSV